MAFIAYSFGLASHPLAMSGVNRPGCLCLEAASYIPGLLQFSWETYGTGCSSSPRMPLDCGVFRAAHKLMICPCRRHRLERRWSSSRADVSQFHWASLGSQLLWLFGMVPCLLPWVQQISWKALMLQVLQRNREANDLLIRRCRPEGMVSSFKDLFSLGFPFSSLFNYKVYTKHIVHVNVLYPMTISI